MRNYKNHIITGETIILIFDDGAEQINKTSTCYNKVKSMLQSKDFSSLWKVVSPKELINNNTYGEFKVKDGAVYHYDTLLPNDLASRILDFINKDIPILPLQRFWSNLRKNPNIFARAQLFGFLENNGIPITEDGCFIAYKRVNENFTDIFTGKISNKPNEIVKMQRDKVNTDSSVACSTGLHVAAFTYAKEHYGDSHSNQKIIEVKVNPMDVVSVPEDYNRMKMRVCKYKVLGVCKTNSEDNGLASRRTYYYSGNSNTFNPDLVSSKKPAKYCITVRAKNLDEAKEIIKSEL